MNLENRILQLKEMLEKDNIPLSNVIRNEYAPPEIVNEFKSLISEHSEVTGNDRLISKRILITILENLIDLDSKKLKIISFHELVIIEKDHIVFESYPELQDLEDNLVEVGLSDNINKSGFHYKNHFLIYPEELQINFHLIEWIRANRNPNIRLFFFPDFNKLGIPETETSVCLKAHWWGPKSFSGLKSNFSSDVIVKGARENILPILDKTEFYFRKQDDMIMLEIEEMIPMTGCINSYTTFVGDRKISFYTRYLHAMLDKDMETCFHIDGCLREYGSPHNFKKRNLSLDLKKKREIKNISTRLKLFKINSEKGINNFQEIIGLFFLHNPYIQEFFEGETEETQKSEMERIGILKLDFENGKFPGV